MQTKWERMIDVKGANADLLSTEYGSQDADRAGTIEPNAADCEI